MLLCEIAGVSRSGYYKWKKRINDPSEKVKEDQFIMSKIGECERDPDIKGSYGYRRICIWLKRYYGLQVNHKMRWYSKTGTGYRYQLFYMQRCFI